MHAGRPGRYPAVGVEWRQFRDELSRGKGAGRQHLRLVAGRVWVHLTLDNDTALYDWLVECRACFRLQHFRIALSHPVLLKRPFFRRQRSPRSSLWYLALFRTVNAVHGNARQVVRVSES